MSDWQPIETAPKDRWLLGWAPGWQPVTMCWIDMQSLKGYEGVVGWFVEWTNHGERKCIEATHWAPLPAPPKPPK